MISRKACSRFAWWARDLIHAADRLEFALVNDGHAVADGLDFAEFVRREENGFALVFQALDDFADFHAAQRDRGRWSARPARADRDC